MKAEATESVPRLLRNISKMERDENCYMMLLLEQTKKREKKCELRNEIHFPRTKQWPKF